MTPSKTQEEKITSLIPRIEMPKIAGKMFYSESNQCWNIIRLKKDILQRFPQLKEKQADFCYKMNMYSDFNELGQEIKALQKKGETVPILLMFYKKKIEQE